MYINRLDPSNKRYIQKQVGASLTTVSSEFLLRLPEILLNKAEALAMLDRSEEAMAVLEELRVKRVVTAEYKPLDMRSGEKLVELIRDERRRELCGEGQRWFDLRRYAVSPKYPEKKSIRHETYDKNGVLEGDYVLKPYGEDPAWVLPIPGYEIVYNQGNLVDNPQRVERKLE